jgi:heme exporter protein CcmD
MSEWFAMNGHGVYVWSAYAITIAVFALNLWLARSAHTRNIRLARESRDESMPARRPNVRQVQ